MNITEHQARVLFDRGYPVRLVDKDGEVVAPYTSIVTGYARTFSKFRTGALRYLDGSGRLPVQWDHNPKRSTYGEAAGHIMRSEPFEIGHVSARLTMLGRGDLPEKYLDDLITTAAYIVYSYRTPIAWVRTDGSICIPPVRYSNTTTQHQWMVARALGVSFSTTESARKGKGRTPYTPREGW